MNQNTTFSYSYSSKENKEILEIRKKYLPESKMDELKRLDRSVQASGIAGSLITGVIGFMLFGLGVCLAFQIIGYGIFSIIFGSLLSIAGTVGIVLAYPVYRLVSRSAKEKYTPRILELISQISKE